MSHRCRVAQALHDRAHRRANSGDLALRIWRATRMSTAPPAVEPQRPHRAAIARPLCKNACPETYYCGVNAICRIGTSEGSTWRSLALACRSSRCAVVAARVSPLGIVCAFFTDIAPLHVCYTTRTSVASRAISALACARGRPRAFGATSNAHASLSRRSLRGVRRSQSVASRNRFCVVHRYHAFARVLYRVNGRRVARNLRPCLRTAASVSTGDVRKFCI